MVPVVPCWAGQSQGPGPTRDAFGTGSGQFQDGLAADRPPVHSVVSHLQAQVDVRARNALRDAAKHAQAAASSQSPETWTTTAAWLSSRPPLLPLLSFAAVARRLLILSRCYISLVSIYETLVRPVRLCLRSSR